jgi:hypothetical protein
MHQSSSFGATDIASIFVLLFYSIKKLSILYLRPGFAMKDCQAYAQQAVNARCVGFFFHFLKCL